MNEKDRIRLAETMGICPNDHEDVCLDSTWNEFDKCVDCGVRVEDGHTFDPEHDANDCEALITHLNGQGYEIDVLHWKEGDATIIIKSDFKLRHGEVTAADWKQGVCELALKVLT